MNINSEGKLEIDVFDIFDNIPKESIPELIESLSCSEVVINHVVDQLLYGCTENGYFGSKCIKLTPSTALDIAKDRIAKESGRVASERIRELEKLVKSAEALTSAGWDAYHELSGRNC